MSSNEHISEAVECFSKMLIRHRILFSIASSNTREPLWLWLRQKFNHNRCDGSAWQHCFLLWCLLCFLHCNNFSESSSFSTSISSKTNMICSGWVAIAFSKPKKLSCSSCVACYAGPDSMHELESCMYVYVYNVYSVCINLTKSNQQSKLTF